MRIHTHLADELPAQAWTGKDELLLHLSEYHGMLVGPVGKTIGKLARVHAGEHEEPGGG